MGAVWPHAYSTVYYRIWWALFGLMPIALYIIGYSGPYFCRIWNSYLTLFWALFGLMPLSTVREGSMQSFTKRVGEILLMVYHIMAIIVLINMLIAMMSSSFQEIEVRGFANMKTSSQNGKASKLQ